MAHEQHVAINGLSVQYWEANPGGEANVLLLHGGIGDVSLNWEAAMNDLAATYRVVAPELPGFGGSAQLAELRISTLAAWVHDLIETLELGPVLLVGHSLGGLLARLVAVHYPDSVRALVLINGGAIPNIPSGVRSALGGLARLPGLGKASSNLLGRMFMSPKQLLYSKDLLSEDFQQRVNDNRKSFGDLTQAVIADSLPENLAPPSPTLLLWGTEDELFPLSDGKRIQRSIPDSELVTIAECGHMPHLEAVDAFVTQIDQFLIRLERTGRTNLPGAGMLGDQP